MRDNTSKRVAARTPRGRNRAASYVEADVTLMLPDDLLLMLIRHGGAETALSMEAVCGRYLRLLREMSAPLWQPWALTRFPVLRGILAAVPSVPGGGPRRPPDFRALYRMHLELELRRKGARFEKVGLLYSAPVAVTNPTPTPTPAERGGSTLDGFVLTVQIFSYDDVLASSSCAASGLTVKREPGSPSHAVAKLRMPSLWSKQTTPGFLAGQLSWTAEQIGAWDMGRMTAHILATRISDMQPLLLYSGEQYAGSSNESYFSKVVLPSEEDEDHSCLAAAVHLTDDEGEVELAILRTIPLMTRAQGCPMVHIEEDEPDGEHGEQHGKQDSSPTGKYILESARVADVLCYLESGAPWGDDLVTSH